MQQPIVKLTEDIGQIPGTSPGVFTVGQIIKQAAHRRPIKADTNAEAFITGIKTVADLLIQMRGVLPSIVITVDQKRHMALIFVCAWRQLRKLVGHRNEKSLEIVNRNRLPAFSIMQPSRVRNVVL